MLRVDFVVKRRGESNFINTRVGEREAEASPTQGGHRDYSGSLSMVATGPVAPPAFPAEMKM